MNLQTTINTYNPPEPPPDKQTGNEMKVLTLYSLAFQRNGVQGEPFYTALIKYRENGEIIDNMLITFTTIDDKKINWNNCRVVNLADCTQAWRGDVLAGLLQKYFDKLRKEKGGTIYDCCTKTEIYSV